MGFDVFECFKRSNILFKMVFKAVLLPLADGQPFMYFSQENWVLMPVTITKKKSIAAGNFKAILDGI